MGISLFFSVKWFFIKEQLFVFQKFYRVKSFVVADLALFFFSFFYNPYRACRLFWKKEGFSYRIYGETPIRAFSQITSSVSIKKEDHLLEMGSGRGKLCFWSASFLGCSVTGVEKVSFFQRIALFIQKKIGIQNLRFIQKDLLEIDYSPYSVIYFYATAQEEPFLDKVFHKMLSCKKGTTIITVSTYPSETLPKDFVLQKKQTFRFPWGEGTVFFSKKL